MKLLGLWSRGGEFFRRYVFLGIFRWLSFCRYHKRREVFLLFSVHSFDFRNESGPIVEPKHFHGLQSNRDSPSRHGSSAVTATSGGCPISFMSRPKKVIMLSNLEFFPLFHVCMMYVIVLFIYYCVLVWFKQVIQSPIQTSIAKRGIPDKIMSINK